MVRHKVMLCKEMSLGHGRVELKDMVVALLEVWKDNRTDDIPVSSDSFCLLVGLLACFTISKKIY